MDAPRLTRCLWRHALVVGILLTTSAAFAAPRSLAVLELVPQPRSVDVSTARLLTDVVRGAAAEGLRGTRFTVVSRDIIDQTLSELEKRGETCDLGSCDAEIAGNLGASHFITGEVVRLGKSLVVTVKLSRQADNVLMGSRQVRAANEEEMFDGLASPTGDLVQVLKDGETPQPAPPAAVSAPVAGAALPQASPTPSAVPPAKQAVATFPGRHFSLFPAPDLRESAARRRRDTRAELQKLAETTPTGEKRLEVVAQLAAAHAEEGLVQRAVETAAHTHAVEAWNKGGRRGQEPLANHAASLKEFRRALQLVQGTIGSFPRFANMDEYLFLGSALWLELGDLDAAMKFATELIKQYPASRRATAAYVVMGQHHFRANDLAKARMAFNKATDAKDFRVYLHALTMLAWCDLNAGDAATAVRKFRVALGYAHQELSRQPGHAETLQRREELLEDLVAGYAQLEAVDDAYAYLSLEAQADAVRLMELLASRLHDAGKQESSRAAYALLLKRHPSDPHAPTWRERVAPRKRVLIPIPAPGAAR